MTNLEEPQFAAGLAPGVAGGRAWRAGVVDVEDLGHLSLAALFLRRSAQGIWAMRRTITWVVALTLVGCSSRPPGSRTAGKEEKAQRAAEREALPDWDAAMKNVKAQAREVRRAMLEEDHGAMARLMHPTLVRLMGGRTKVVRHLLAEAADFKRQGFQFTDVVLSDPSHFREAAGELYAVIPYKLELTGPGGATGSAPSFLVGVSIDGGSNWTFIDGAGLAADREKLRRVVPNVPDDLPLPAVEKPRWRYGKG